MSLPQSGMFNFGNGLVMGWDLGDETDETTVLFLERRPDGWWIVDSLQGQSAREAIHQLERGEHERLQANHLPTRS